MTARHTARKQPPTGSNFGDPIGNREFAQTHKFTNWTWVRGDGKCALNCGKKQKLKFKTVRDKTSPNKTTHTERKLTQNCPRPEKRSRKRRILCFWFESNFKIVSDDPLCTTLPVSRFLNYVHPKKAHSKLLASRKTFK